MAVQLTAKNGTAACDVVSLDILHAVGKMSRPHITDGKPVLVSDSNLKQRLAAILAADVTGYSRLMAANERETIGIRCCNWQPCWHAGRQRRCVGPGGKIQLPDMSCGRQEGRRPII